jgi:hypothetical protein
MSAGLLARTLDQEMLERAGVSIHSAITPDVALPIRRGDEVSLELGGRLLVRYMLRRQLGLFAGGSSDKHYVTPTPLSQSDAPSFLALPVVAERRSFAMLVDPREIDEIQGPRWVRGGNGIEYLLPSGFRPSAVLLGWEIEIR